MEPWDLYKNYHTLELINFFQNLKNSPKERDSCFFAIVFRFRQDLVGKCEIIFRKYNYSIDQIIEIVENTFSKYYKTHNFTIEKSSVTNVDLAFKTYLYSISRNELKNFYSNLIKKQNGLLYDGNEQIVTQMPNVPYSKLNNEEKIYFDTLKSLSYSHRVIYLTYKSYGKDGVNLPKELQAKIRTHLGNIKQSTVRKYKKEACDIMDRSKEIVKRLQNAK